MTSLPSPLLPPDDQALLGAAFRSFAEAAGSLERSYRLLRSEVERLHVELARSRAGLARSLEENQEMRRDLDRILDGLPCGVMVVNRDGGIARINPEGRRLLEGLPPDESWGTSLGERAGSSLFVPAGLLHLLDLARCEPGEREGCFRDEGKASDEFWLAVRHAPVPPTRAAGGERPTGGEADAAALGEPASIFILRDVSEAKRRLRERERSRRDQALAEMSAVLAHEIRNPLGSLELFAGLLAGTALSPECQRWVEHVQAGLRTLAATVNNVLHFHSLPPPERTATDMGALLDWAGGFLAPVAHQAGAELRLSNHLAGVWFDADRHRLEQVLLNLALNALRAVRQDGWVEISGRQVPPGETPAIAIRVRDSGTGIAEEAGKRLFEPGFTTRPGSPGLGLAVCRRIVEQHGGTLEAANRAGGGACFTVKLPWGGNVSREIAAREITRVEAAG